MSVADQFDVYLFPHDIPVNLATPGDLDRLRQVFADRELYLAVGSDVVANASSYKAPPTHGSVHSMNHIVFRRSSDAEGREIEADLSCITGRIIQLQLPTHLEDISSTRIRENIDLGRDISSLIDRWCRTSSTATASISGSPSTNRSSGPAIWSSPMCPGRTGSCGRS